MMTPVVPCLKKEYFLKCCGNLQKPPGEVAGAEDPIQNFGSATYV